MMLEDSRVPGMITAERFHAVLRPWNIFNECDLDKSHTLDDKEVEILLWFQLRHRPTPEFVSSFANFIDDDGNGEISRTEWTHAILKSERLARGGTVNRNQQEAGDKTTNQQTLLELEQD